MIKDLTDRKARFPRLGIIHKGDKRKPYMKDGKEILIAGNDLDYFRLDCKDEAIIAAWENHYSKEPKQLDCMLIALTTEEAFPCWMEEWGHGSLKRRCDGEEQSLWLTPQDTYKFTPIPCLKVEGKECECKQVGRLSIILPKIGRMGYFEVQTHSKWDIIGLTEQLLAVEMSARQLTGIPFLLKRERRPISTVVKGKKAIVEKSLLSIEVHPDIASRIIQAVEQRAFAMLPGSEPQPLLSQSQEGWVEKGVNWAIGQGLSRQEAEVLLATGIGRREFFEAVKTRLASVEF